MRPINSYRPPTHSLASLPVLPMRESVLEKRIRTDLRAIREAAELSQEAVADLFNWNRDAISKIERGERRIRIYEYLRIMDVLRERVPNHPALVLIDHYAPLRDRIAGGGKNPFVEIVGEDGDDY